MFWKGDRRPNQAAPRYDRSSAVAMQDDSNWMRRWHRQSERHLERKESDLRRKEGRSKCQRRSKPRSFLTFQLWGFRTTPDRRRGILINLNSETDFVAKSDEFKKFLGLSLTRLLEINDAIDVTKEQPDKLTGILKDLKLDGSDSIEDSRKLLSAKTKEKIEFGTIRNIVSKRCFNYQQRATTSLGDMSIRKSQKASAAQAAISCFPTMPRVGQTDIRTEPASV